MNARILALTCAALIDGLAACGSAGAANASPTALASGGPVTKCPAPLVWDALQGLCQTPDTIAPRNNACTATLIFDPDDPSQLRLLVTPQGCSASELQYALEAARARLRWTLEK